MNKEDKSVLGGFESIMETFQSGFKPETDDKIEPIERQPGEGELEPPAKIEPSVETTKEPDTFTPDIIQTTPETETDVESEYVTGMFEVFAEKYGWEGSETKPATVEDLIEYFDEKIKQNSTIDYANDTIKEIDDFVKNGGKLEDYFNLSANIDYETIDISSEFNQKRILTDLFTKQGLTEQQIEKKLTKYEMADILQDEAEEAIEVLQDLANKEKESLLIEQKKQKEIYEENQRSFYNNVIKEVEELNEIRGIKISDKDKKDLKDYIFKPTKSGRTQYQEDYASSITNLVESAYFTKNKKQLIDSAKKEGEKTAIERFKNKLKAGSTIGSKQSISGGSTRSFLDLI